MTEITSQFLNYRNKVITDREKFKLIAEDQRAIWRIGTVNGCFDILHPGHLHIMYQAKRRVDKLFVLVNSDKSVKKNKGPERPINFQWDRCEILSALTFVDFVHVFDEETPCELLKIIRPHMHFNDASYGEDCVEAGTLKEIGASLCLIDKLETPSTTDTINTIREG